MTDIRLFAQIEELTHISSAEDDDNLDVSDFVYEVVHRLGKLDNATHREKQECFREAAAVCVRAIESLGRRIDGSDHRLGSQ